MRETKSHVFALLLLSVIGTSDLSTSEFREKLESALPFIQASAFATVFVNNALQIAKSLGKSKDLH